jgi:hypothetical protein
VCRLHDATPQRFTAVEEGYVQMQQAQWGSWQRSPSLPALWVTERSSAIAHSMFLNIVTQCDLGCRCGPEQLPGHPCPLAFNQTKVVSGPGLSNSMQTKNGEDGTTHIPVSTGGVIKHLPKVRSKELKHLPFDTSA